MGKCDLPTAMREVWSDMYGGDSADFGSTDRFVVAMLKHLARYGPVTIEQCGVGDWVIEVRNVLVSGDHTLAWAIVGAYWAAKFVTAA